MSDTIYPVQPDSVQRKYLLELLNKHLEELDKQGGGEPHRQWVSLSNFWIALTNCEGVDSVDHHVRLAFAKDESRAKEIHYGIQKVSDRKYVIVKRSTGGFLNGDAPREAGAGDVPMMKYEVVSHKVSRDIAERIYAWLVSKNEVPEVYKSLMFD